MVTQRARLCGCHCDCCTLHVAIGFSIIGQFNGCPNQTEMNPANQTAHTDKFSLLFAEALMSVCLCVCMCECFLLLQFFVMSYAHTHKHILVPQAVFSFVFLYFWSIILWLLCVFLFRILRSKDFKFTYTNFPLFSSIAFPTDSFSVTFPPPSTVNFIMHARCSV